MVELVVVIVRFQNMSTVSLAEAQAHLGELISSLPPGEELLIAQAGQPLAKLVRAERTSWPCRAGSAADKILWIAPDFDEPLEEFQEYME
jgi:antitoxin (DNA-binding transcriptional repressor) of toxin-antitoxin stability system